MGMGMTYDGVRGRVVLFGGTTLTHNLGDTWTWDGTTWTEQNPAVSPSARWAMGMSYDAASSEALLFGGSGVGGVLGDTWTWDGTTWRIPFVAHLHLDPQSGPPRTGVKVKATGFAAVEQVTITFIDSVNGKTILGTFAADARGVMRTRVKIPRNATTGTQRIIAAGSVSRQKAKTTFTVT
jgi:hypothetical protein